MNPVKIIIILIVALIIIGFVTFTVDETKQVVILQMGKPVRTVKDAGLHFKIPYPIQSVVSFEKRILDYDAPPTEILTKDKKNLVVDNYAKWRIDNPLKFFVSVHDENGGQARLNNIIYSELRVSLGLHDLEEVVTTQRAALMATVTKASNEKMLEYGIEVLDVRIKRADLPEQNERSIYERMRAERKRIANRYRSEGEEEAIKIRAVTDSLKVVIMANAYKESQIIKGKAEAKAIEIYAKAYGRDESFYDFYRTLEAYKTIIDDKTIIVLPPDTELLKYFK
ncbi:MAG: protease modulator HflC [Candidatus Hatepunaea meridiana]|nr:protease modulator HflC [Candidatus Hatepunaea meridiana]